MSHLTDRTYKIKRHYRLRALWVSISIFTIFLVLASQPTHALAAKQKIRITGQTMGTIYQVQMIAGDNYDADKLKVLIENRLEKINQSMSTFLTESEISRFNALKRTDQPLRVSKDFNQVMTLAKTLHRLTVGAWDGTLAPLVNLWGFGSAKATDQVPSHQAIAARLSKVGFGHIEITQENRLKKNVATVTLDLASIAKGHAVDAVAHLIVEKGFRHFLVEIGGEIYASGTRLDGRPWRVGLNRPERDAPFDAVYKVVDLSDKALATSGDYRNYFESNGRFYGHILDPRTGYPVTNGVVSVSVLADTCALADGLATGIMVMGVEKGLALVNRLDHVECLIVVRDSNDRLNDHLSKGFPAEKR